MISGWHDVPRYLSQGAIASGVGSPSTSMANVGIAVKGFHRRAATKPKHRIGVSSRSSAPQPIMNVKMWLKTAICKVAASHICLAQSVDVPPELGTEPVVQAVVSERVGARPLD